MTQHDADLPIYLRDTQIANMYGISRITVWRWARNGLLPQPLRLGPSTTRWRLADIEAYEARTVADGGCDEG